MQPPRSSGSAELTRSDGSGLARYQSAPATWLEALLESDEEQTLPDVVLDNPKPPPPNASAADMDLELLESGGGGFSNFLRMNSSPAEFLSLLNSSEGFFSNLGIPANYEFVPATVAKRAREAEDLDKISPKRSSSSSSIHSVWSIDFELYLIGYDSARKHQCFCFCFGFEVPSSSSSSFCWCSSWLQLAE